MTETLRCHACQASFVRQKAPGTKPRRCPGCKTKNAAVPDRPGPKPFQGPTYGLAKKVTDYRLAIEIARSGIRLGRYAEALAALDGAVR